MPVKNFIDLPFAHLDTLLHELDIAGRELLHALASFSQEQFNRVPFAGSWTAGQVGEHLYKSLEGIPYMMAGDTAPATGRKPDEHVMTIESIFLDYDTKMQSPDFILPSAGPQDRNAQLQDFRATLDDLAVKARTMDLSFTCNEFEFPGVDLLTRWEWLVFAICHTKRHTVQLRNIYQHVATVAA
jgi:hypothetical protein